MSQKIKIIVQAIDSDKYEELVSPLHFINSAKSIFDKFLGINAEKTYRDLIVLIQDSLKYRFKNGFMLILSQISKPEVQNLKGQYQKFETLNNNHELNKHLKESFVSDFLNKGIKAVVQKCSQLIDSIYSQIKERNYEHLKEPFLLVNDLREVGREVSIQTSDRYSQVKISLERQIFNETF